MKRNGLILLVVFFTNLGFSQNSLNDYKYIIVPNKFEFFKQADQFQLNSLSKFLFNKYGFSTYLMDETLPKDALKNRCLVLNADVLEKKTMFKTKLAVQLKNCEGDIIYTTPQGESRKKQLKSAYNEALRIAFNNFATIKYKYIENNNALPTTENSIESEESKKEIEQLKQEIKTLKEDKKENVATDKTLETPKSTEVIVKKLKVKTKELKTDENQLYAQAMDNGFQLVDKTPKVVYTIYNSGKKDFFIVKGIDAVIYKLNDNWVIAKQNGIKLETKILNIKF